MRLGTFDTFCAAVMIASVLSGVAGVAVKAGPLEDGIAAQDRGHFRQAYKDFLKGAQAGNAEAQVQLARMLIESLGVRRDLDAAADWLKRAATQGHAYAMYRLGTLIEDGLSGKRDPAKAARWYKRAARRLEPNAAYRLAVLYEEGRGVAANPAEAMRLYRLAAKGSVLKATHRLGSMLVKRQQKSADLMEGVVWLELASRGGDFDVSDELKAARASLTAAQRDVVRARVQSHVRTEKHH